MRKLFLVLSLIASSLALAVPAKPIKRLITLADGTQKQVVLRGDEYGHYYVDADGVYYTKSQGDVFAVADKEALLKRRSEKLAINNERRMKRAKQWGLIREDGSFGWQQKGNEIADGRNKARWGAFSNPISGKRKGLVILVNFADLSMKTAHSQSFYNDFFNKEGFVLENMSGSVHDYFMECSYGQFDLSFDVVGPVTVSKNYAYYGGNDTNGDDKYPAVLVSEACKLADQKGVNFSQYDWDGDGEVEQVFVLFAGYGEAASNIDNTIWPHEHSLTGEKTYGDGNGAIMLDGVKVDTYALSCELAGGSGSYVDGIGTACHEFSHCMCLPDLYNTSNGTSAGLEYWDLMDSGSYAGPRNHGECPTAYTSYERMYCGWLTPMELSSPTVVSDMKDIVTSSEAYIIYNQKNRNEFYLLENRQKVGFNKYNSNHGLLIFHVDFDSSSWANNAVNNSKSHPRLMIVPADNSLSSYNDVNDTWPGKTGNTAFTDTSVPAATLFNSNVDGRKFLGKPIEEIYESGAGTISFIFDGGLALDAPVAHEALNVTHDGFTATWSEVEGVTYYELEMTPLRADNKLLYEGFSGFNNGLQVDGSADISEQLDGYTDVPGWSGERLFLSPRDEVKMGTSKMNGEITTPTVSVTKGMLTLYLDARQYNQDDVKLVVKINGSEIATLTNPIASDLNRFTAPVQGDAKVTISTLGGRAYLSELMVYDGDYMIPDKGAFDVDNDLISNCFVVDGRSYNFTSLNPLYEYSYRVRACAGDLQSEWSNSVKVKLLKDADGVDIVAVGTEGKDVKIYDLMGRRVRGNVKPGIYIVDGKKMRLK